MFENLYRSVRLHPGEGEGGGSGSAGLILGKYENMEAATAGHKSLESKLTEVTEENKRLKEESARREATNRETQHDSERKAVEAEIASAKKALEEFEEKTDLSTLSGKDHAVATRKFNKLSDAVEAAEAKLGKVANSKSEKDAESRAYANIGAFDRKSLQQIEGMTSEKIAEVAKFAEKHNTVTLMEAHYRMQAESLAKELKELKAKYDANFQPANRQRDTDKGGDQKPKALNPREVVARAVADPKVDSAYTKYLKSVGRSE